MVPGIVGSEVDIENVAQPVRRRLIERRQLPAGRVEERGLRAEVVIAEGGKELYDHLILALGSQPNFFGVPG